VKILQVSSYPPGRYGGSERFAMQLSKNLAARGHEVTLLTSNIDKNIKYELIDGVDVYRHKCYTNIWNINPLTIIISKLIKDADKYDIIHAHGYIFLTSNQVALAKKIKNYKYILHMHGGLIPEIDGPSEKKFLVKKWFYDTTLGRFTINSADVVASVSKIDILNSIRIFNTKKDKFVWIPPAVDTKKFCNFNSNKNNASENNKVNITFIGRLEPWKGPDLFIKLARKIVNHNKNDIRFTVVGDGSLKNKLLNKTRDLPITFLGTVNHDKIPEVLSETTILILPSRLEGLPTVCIEASACGVPIIASNVGGTSEIVQHGYNGFLFDPSDLNLAFESSLKVIDSNKLRKNMGSNGIRLVHKYFTWDNIINKVEKVYKKII
jgi:glycogen(starch) synthase